MKIFDTPKKKKKQKNTRVKSVAFAYYRFMIGEFSIYLISFFGWSKYFVFFEFDNLPPSSSLHRWTDKYLSTMCYLRYRHDPAQGEREIWGIHETSRVKFECPENIRGAFIISIFFISSITRNDEKEKVNERANELKERLECKKKKKIYTCLWNIGEGSEYPTTLVFLQRHIALSLRYFHILYMYVLQTIRSPKSIFLHIVI